MVASVFPLGFASELPRSIRENVGPPQPPSL